MPVLAGAVEQIEKYPSGGELTITGHTDDVADDAHNQDLSERRAEAVSERLKELTDLSKWNQSVSGEGESSPRVPNDHRRAQTGQPPSGDHADAVEARRSRCVAERECGSAISRHARSGRPGG